MILKKNGAMMKIVIDIPDEIYKKYMDDRTHVTDVLHAVRNGTPLPERHGRIADLSTVYEDICNDINAMTRIGVAIDGDWLWAKLNDAIDNAPTIIEGE